MDAQGIYDLIQSLKRDVDYVAMKPSTARNIKKKVDRIFEEVKKYGIQLAASVAADYDASSVHSHLVSDCILGKLNLLKGAPRKNPNGVSISEALTRLERKIDSLEGTCRFMTRHTNRKRSTTRPF